MALSLLLLLPLLLAEEDVPAQSEEEEEERLYEICSQPQPSTPLALRVLERKKERRKKGRGILHSE